MRNAQNRNAFDMFVRPQGYMYEMSPSAKIKGTQLFSTLYLYFFED